MNNAQLKARAQQLAAMIPPMEVGCCHHGMPGTQQQQNWVDMQNRVGQDHPLTPPSQSKVQYNQTDTEDEGDEAAMVMLHVQKIRPA